jgi:hypothetical protein
MDQLEKDQKTRPDGELELFVQAEGLADIKLAKFDRNATVREALAALASKFGGVFEELKNAQNANAFLEDSDKELNLDRTLDEQEIKNRSRLHIHRCRRIKVSVNFNGQTITDSFPPSTTVRRVKKWADKEFDIDKADAVEHALQLCGTATRPDEDTHIGALTTNPACSVCFDLVPKIRVEGAWA